MSPYTQVASIVERSTRTFPGREDTAINDPLNLVVSPNWWRPHPRDGIHSG